MLSAVAIVLPIFALVLAGFLARRLGALGPGASTEINRFVVQLALPALLFDIVANSHGDELWQPGFIAAFGLSSLAAYGLAFALRLRARQSLADLAIEGLDAGYANVGFMGFPLGLQALGHDALVPATIASIITICVVFALAIVLIEISRQSGTRGLALVMRLGGSLLRNPLVVTPFLGALFPLTGLGVPAPLGVFLKLLGGAASPCALVALGLYLANDRAPHSAARSHGAVAWLVAVKLVAHPALAWLLAYPLLDLAPVPARAAVLFAALPTGTGAFMLAGYYGHGIGTTSRAILLSTLLSVVTLSLYIATLPTP